MKTPGFFILLFLISAVTLCAQDNPDRDPFGVVKSAEELTLEKAARQFHIRTMTETMQVYGLSGEDTTNSYTTTWSATFNPDGQLASDSSKLGGKSVYTYDKNGRLTGASSSQIVKSCSYDAQGRLSSVTVKRAPSLEKTRDEQKHIYTYDTAGRVVIYSIYLPAINPKPVDEACESRQVRTYDKQGRLIRTSTTHPESGNMPGFAEYTYGDSGHTVYASDPYGTFYATYDAGGRILSCVDSTRGDNVSRYTYNAAGQLTGYYENSPYDDDPGIEDHNVYFTRIDYFYKEGMLTGRIYHLKAGYQTMIIVSAYSYTFY